MTIEVEGPNGEIVEFPDGTPHETMQNAMRKHFNIAPPASAPAAAPVSPQPAPMQVAAAPSAAREAHAREPSDRARIRNALDVSFDKAAPIAPKVRPTDDFLANTARMAIGQGVGFGSGDEIEAGVRSVLPGSKGYSTELKDIRHQLEDYRKANPEFATGAEGLGMMVSPVTRVLANAMTAKPVADSARTAGQALVESLTQGAKVGGAGGGLAGFLHGGGEDDLSGAGNRLFHGAMGAGVGAATGAVLNPLLTAGQDIGTRAGRTLTRTGQAKNEDTIIAENLARDRVTAQQLEDQLPDLVSGRARSLTNPAEIARAKDLIASGASLKEVASEFGVSTKTLNARLSAGENDVPLSVLDLAKLERIGGGANVAGVAKGAAAIPGPGKAVAQQELMSRQLAQQDRLVNAIRRHVSDQEAEPLLASMEKVRKEAADKAYGVARDYDMRQAQSGNQLDLQPILDGWAMRYQFSRGPIAKATKEVIEAFRPQSLSTTGEPISKPIRSLDEFLMAKDDLDAIMSQHVSNPKIMRVLAQMKDELTGAVASHNPYWKVANDEFASNITGEKAVQLGRDFATRLGAIQREDIKMFSRLPPEAKALVRHGLAENLSDEVLNKGGGDVAALLGRRGAEKAIRQLLPKEQADALLNVVRQEKVTSSTNREFQGSRTTPLGEEVADMRQMPETIGAALMGRADKVLTGVYNRYIRGVTETNADGIIQKLLETDPAKVRAILNQLKGAEKRLAIDHMRRIARSNAVSGAISGEVAGLLAENDGRAAGGRINKDIDARLADALRVAGRYSTGSMVN